MICAPRSPAAETTGPPMTSAAPIWQRMHAYRRACDVSALDDALAAVAAAMPESASRWYPFGAQAATLWGRPRLTPEATSRPKSHVRAWAESERPWNGQGSG